MLELVRKVAQEAGRKILTFYGDDVAVEYKEDESPLTAADRAAHDHISDSLTKAFPDIPVISEEGLMPSYEVRREMTRFWLVDPLDGTKEFIKKNDEFTVNIALIEDGYPVLGVVDAPALDIRYFAARGEGAFRQQGNQPPQQLRTKTMIDMNNLTAAMSRSHGSGPMETLIERLGKVDGRAVGSSLKFCQVADGRIDFYPRFGPLNEWDTAAAHMVAEEAGAIVRHMNGERFRYNKEVMLQKGGFLAAANQALMDRLHELVADLLPTD